MNTLQEWAAVVCAGLGIDAAFADSGTVLDLARDVAHGVARPAAPLTAYLVGGAGGGGPGRPGGGGRGGGAGGGPPGGSGRPRPAGRPPPSQAIPRTPDRRRNLPNGPAFVPSGQPCTAVTGLLQILSLPSGTAPVCRTTESRGGRWTNEGVVNDGRI